MRGLAATLIFAGLGLAALGGILLLLTRFGITPGRLPGDIVHKSGNTTIFFPLTTMVIVSLLLTGILWLVQFLRR